MAADDIRKIVPDLTDEEVARSDFGEYTAEQYFDDLGRITQYYIDPDLAEIIVHREYRHRALDARARHPLHAQLWPPGL